MSQQTFSAEYWIEKLQLAPHVEGGAYRELYRSPLKLQAPALPKDFGGERNACTHIYFLLRAGNFSAFHRILSDEIWHFYYGDPLIIYEIDAQGKLEEHMLGSSIGSFQCVIRAGNWFGSRVAPGSNYSLVGCTVAPGFDFNDFELAQREKLLAEYPQHRQLITGLTR